MPSLIAQNQSAYSIGSGGNDTLNGALVTTLFTERMAMITLDGGALVVQNTTASNVTVIVITSSSGSDTLTDLSDGTDAIGFDSSLLSSSGLTIVASGSDHG